MNHLAEVYLWGTRIGILYLGEGRNWASFEYDRDFVRSVRQTDIQLSPICMPVSDRVYEFPGLGEAFHGVPGLIADSLPDKFGNAVIRQWLAGQGKSEADFTVIDRLCYTGKRGMGALEYVPALGPDPSADDVVRVSEMVQFASDVLNSRNQFAVNMEENASFAQLLQLGTSAGGARAKAIIAWNEKTNEVRSGQIDAGQDFSYWLMKFDGVSKNGDHELEDVPEYTRIEYAYYKMACEAGIHMEECRLFEENGRYHFMTRRFDRTGEDKLHTQTLGALTHIDYNTPGLCSYEQAAGYMRQMGLGYADIEQFFRRMVFNVAAVNQDDHVKNVSFLMDRDGVWKLAPAYDITFAYNSGNYWLRAHQMTVNGKAAGIEKSDILSAGKAMGLSARKMENSIHEVRTAVSHWERIAGETGIREQTYEMIQSKLEESDLC